MKPFLAAAVVAAVLAGPATADNRQLVALVQNILDRYDIAVDADTLTTQQLAKVKFFANDHDKSRAYTRMRLRAAATGRPLLK